MEGQQRREQPALVRRVARTLASTRSLRWPRRRRFPFWFFCTWPDWLRAVFRLSLFHRGRGRQHSASAVLYSLVTFSPRARDCSAGDCGEMAGGGAVEGGALIRFGGLTYFRWWLGKRLLRAARFYLLASTPWMTFTAGAGRTNWAGCDDGQHYLGAPDLLYDRGRREPRALSSTSKKRGSKAGC